MLMPSIFRENLFDDWFNFPDFSDLDRTERKLRKAEVPVIARINEDRLLLCVRTIADDEIETTAAAFRK